MVQGNPYSRRKFQSQRQVRRLPYIEWKFQQQLNTFLKEFAFAAVSVRGRNCNLLNMLRALVMDDEADARILTKRFWPSMGWKAYGNAISRRLIWR